MALLDPNVRRRGLSRPVQLLAASAVLGVVAVVDIPIVHLSVLWMNSLHQLPTVLRQAGSPQLDASMGMTLGVSVLAFTFVYLALLTERMAIEQRRQAQVLEARA